MLADADGRQPDRADQQRANARGERQIDAVRHLLAQAIRSLGITARTKSALVQALDRFGVVSTFPQNGQRKVVHCGAA